MIERAETGLLNSKISNNLKIDNFQFNNKNSTLTSYLLNYPVIEISNSYENTVLNSIIFEQITSLDSLVIIKYYEMENDDLKPIINFNYFNFTNI